MSSTESLWRRVYAAAAASTGTFAATASAAVVFAALLSSCAFDEQPPEAGSASADQRRGASMNEAFAAASAEFDVPQDLLVAVGYGETHLDGHDGEPSADNGYGVMHLVSNPRRQTLEQAAQLTGLSTAELQHESSANIRGGAAVLRAYADELGLDAAARRDVARWYEVVADYAGASNDQTARLYADTVYELLNRGFQAAVAGGEVVVSPRTVEPELGRYTDVRPIGAATGDLTALQALSVEYPPAQWIPAHGANYSPGRSAAINVVVIHVTQGSYAGTISWFQNPASSVSAHYVIRSSDGAVTQMVRDGDTGFHVRSANSRALGIEHEGFVDNPSWFTDSMYRASAALTRHLCDKFGLPKTRAFIKGHNEMPGNNHTDPGPHWNWNFYIELVNAGGGGGSRAFGGSPTDFTGDGKDDIVTFTHGALADVYTAPSTGSSFAASVKAHDFFALSGETPLTGDFTGDGKDDIVTFTHGSLGDVYVAPSLGTTFAGSSKWHEFFAPGGEAPAVGDFNGDGKDDIVTFTRGSAADVYVALSTGTSFGPGQLWHDFFAPGGEFPAVGDFNGDGKDDIVVFTRGAAADVYVALSTGTGFGPASKVHDFFAPNAEQPRVGDFNGDGKDDIVVFTNNGEADVFVAFWTGSGFGAAARWHTLFSPSGEFPYVGDYNGDGKDDIVTFTKTSSADVWVGLSDGSTFVSTTKWHDFFGLPGETSL